MHRHATKKKREKVEPQKMNKGRIVLQLHFVKLCLHLSLLPKHVWQWTVSPFEKYFSSFFPSFLLFFLQGRPTTLLFREMKSLYFHVESSWVLQCSSHVKAPLPQTVVGWKTQVRVLEQAGTPPHPPHIHLWRWSVSWGTLHLQGAVCEGPSPMSVSNPVNPGNPSRCWSCDWARCVS